MSGLRNFGFVSTVAGAVLVLGGIVAASAAADADQVVPHDKIDICHATQAEDNPYIGENVSVRSVDGGYTTDHSHHIGPIWYAGAKDDDVDWGDIIPPLYPGDAGLNWTAIGEAIWSNDCTMPAPTTTTSTTSTTSTTELSTTTTEGESGGPTTTVALVTTTVEGESGGPTTTTGTMPATGGGEDMLLVAGLAMVGLGLLARLIGRRGATA